MKKIHLSLKAACYLTFVAMLLWLIFYICRAIDNPYRTVPVTSCASEEVIPVSGIIAREEQVLYSVYESARTVLGDGQRVSGGGIVALSYSSAAQLQRAVRLEELRQRSEQLTELLSETGAEGNRQTDSEIMNDVLTLRETVFKRDFKDLTELTLKLDTEVFAAFSTASDIVDSLDRCKVEMRSLQDVRASAEITAPISGIYSSHADGMEDVTPETLAGLMPADLQQMLKQENKTPEYALGKIVSGIRWYYAVTIDSADADRLRGSSRLTVRPDSLYGATVSMRVESMSAADNGKRVLVLSSNSCLSELLDARNQRGDILLSDTEGLRIPRRSLHVDESGTAFVYVQTGMQAERKDVEILADFDDYYMVTGSTLHIGDEVIVSAKNLFNGKVVNR